MYFYVKNPPIILLKMNSPADFSLDTLNNNLIDCAAGNPKFDSLPLSILSCIFNRSLLTQNLNPNCKRGILASEYLYPWVSIGEKNLQLFKNQTTLLVDVKSVLLIRSHALIYAIDNGFNIFRNNHSKMKEDKVFEIATLIGSLYGALHPFCDGNGRTLVALMSYIVQKYTKYKIDLQKYKNNSHSTYLCAFGASFPEYQYSLQGLVKKADTDNTIITFDPVNDFSIYQQLEYRNKLLNNLQGYMNSIDWKKANAKIKEKDFPNLPFITMALENLLAFLKDSAVLK